MKHSNDLPQPSFDTAPTDVILDDARALNGGHRHFTAPGNEAVDTKVIHTAHPNYARDSHGQFDSREIRARLHQEGIIPPIGHTAIEQTVRRPSAAERVAAIDQQPGAHYQSTADEIRSRPPSPVVDRLNRQSRP